MNESDWQRIVVVAANAMSECCGCSIGGFQASKYIEKHLTAEQIAALDDAFEKVDLRDDRSA